MRGSSQQASECKRRDCPDHDGPYQVTYGSFDHTMAQGFTQSTAH